MGKHICIENSIAPLSQVTQCCTCVLLVIIVMVLLGQARRVGLDPGSVQSTATDPPPEQGARVTATRVPLGSTVTLQVRMNS